MSPETEEVQTTQYHLPVRIVETRPLITHRHWDDAPDVIRVLAAIRKDFSVERMFAALGESLNAIIEHEGKQVFADGLRDPSRYVQRLLRDLDVEITMKVRKHALLLPAELDADEEFRASLTDRVHSHETLARSTVVVDFAPPSEVNPPVEEGQP